jgi:hypothetical protein
MSQNGRREFLTSAGAVAAALAACAAPVRRAQAQAPCGSIYKEGDIVSKVAPDLGGPNGLAFRNKLITIPDTITAPAMANLTPDAVKQTFDALQGKTVTSVTVKSPLPPGTPPGPSPGMYTLVSGDTTPGPSNTRWPVVLTMKQRTDGFTSADWNKILLFVIPDQKVGGHDITEAEAHTAMCVHPFGM